MPNKKPMFKDVDKAYEAWSEKHGGNFKDPDDASAAFERTSPRIRGEIRGYHSHSSVSSQYEKRKKGLNHYKGKMKALEAKKKK